MIPLPLLHDQPSPTPSAGPAAGAELAPVTLPRWQAPPWDEEHLCWLAFDSRLPAEHLARLIVDFVAQLDLRPLAESYAGRGSPPCSPELLTRLALYEYSQGRPSPDQWFADTRDSIPVHWLLFGLQPARSTLYAFRDRIVPFIDGWNKSLLEISFLEDYTTGQRAAHDGSFLRARASRHHLLGESGLRRRCQQLEEAIAEDQAALVPGRRTVAPWTQWWLLVTIAILTTPTPAADAPAVELPSAAQLRKLMIPPPFWPAWMATTPTGRREQLRGLRRAQRRWRAKDQQQQARYPSRRQNKRGKGEKRVVVCVSEPEAAIGRDKHNISRPLYNVQILRDLDSEFILAYGTFTATCDSGLLPVMLQRCERLTGRMPSELVADHSYATGLDLAYCRDHDVTLYTPLDPLGPKPTKPDPKYGKELFRYDAERDLYVCPAGQELRPGPARTESRVGGQTVQTVAYQARKTVCAGCAQRVRCTDAKKGRIIKRSEHEPLLEAARQRLASAEGQRIYRLRKQTVELTLARLKGLLGGDNPLTSYGKPRARVQVGLVVLLLNALALYRARQRAGRLHLYSCPEDTDQR